MANRYSSMIHGVGLADEYPGIKYWPDFDDRGYDGVLEPGMTLCVESYTGSDRGGEGVKLEEQILITDTGIEKLSTYPFEKQLL
jgi:Xaa-Pro aminopeptidase